MNFKLMASMMCADYSNLRKEVEALDAGGIDSFHIDIMDGRYVPNYAMSLNDLRCIRSLTSKPLDVHLMVEHPNNTIELFIESLRPGDTIYMSGYVKQFNITKLRGIVPGGATRFLSTKAGMMALGEVADDDVLIVHDAVRPLVSAESI